MSNFSVQKIQQVWEKGKRAPNYDPAVIRLDRCGAWIKWQDYGNRNSDHGWEIHHTIPEAKGGTDAIQNLEPLHWRNNAATGDGERVVCHVRAS